MYRRRRGKGRQDTEEERVERKFTHPSEPTVKPTGFSTLANTPSFSPTGKGALVIYKK